MKKFRYVILLLVMACMSFAFACKDNSSQITLSGFVLTEQEITVDAGDTVFVDNYAKAMQVVDQNGNPQTVLYDVATTSGGYVNSAGGLFVAGENEGYVITYKVKTSDNVVHTLTQKVIVIGDIELYAQYSTRLYSVGDTVTINPVSKIGNATIECVVTERATSANVTVTNNTFVPQNVGWYDITINASAPNANNDTFEYSIYARAPFTTGEVEAFGEDWSIIRELDGYETNPGWSITSTSSTGLFNHKGESDTFVKTTVEGKSAVYYWINPRADRQYYLDLAEQGYDAVSVWAYISSARNDCTETHAAIRYTGRSEPNGAYKGTDPLNKNTNTFSQNGGNTFVEGYWTEFSIRLVDATNWEDYKYSFTSSYDYYKNEWTAFLEFEIGTDHISPADHGKTTVYIGDIYATKKVDIAFKDGAEIDVKKGDTVNFADYIDFTKLPADIQLTYALKKNDGNYEILDGSSYTFNDYAVYELLVTPTQSNYKGSLAVNFTSPKTIDKGTYLVDTSVNATSFDAKDMLNVAEKAIIEALPGDITYNFSGANAQQVNDSVFAIDTCSAGVYTFSAEFMGLTIWKADIDIYDGSQPAVWNSISEQNGKLVGHYADSYAENGTLSVVNSSTDAQLTGKAGDYFRFDNAQKSTKWGIKVLPLHSKAYYETVLGNGEKVVQFEFKFVKNDASTATDTKWAIKRGYNLFNAGDNGNGSSDPTNYLNHIGHNYEPNTWYTIQLSLDYLLANKWDNAINETKGGSWLAGHSTNGDAYAGAFSVYLGNVQVLGTAEWRSEYYLPDGEGGYVLDDTYTQTGSGFYGTALTHDKREIEIIDEQNDTTYSYVVDESAAGNVLEGSITAGETFVLKAYYKLKGSVKKLGLRNDATLDLKALYNEGYTGDYNNVTITALNVAGSKYDMTTAYEGLIDNGVMDTASIDGLFEILVEGDQGSTLITFEQYKDGVITWNNINDVNNVFVRKYNGVALDADKKYSLKTIAASELPEEGVSGKPAYVPGNDYYKFVITDITSFGNFGFGIIPVHSKAYYESLMADGKDITIITDYHYTKGGETPAVYSRWQVGSGLGHNRADYEMVADSWVGKSTTGDESRHGMSLATLLENWDALIEGNGTMVGYRGALDDKSEWTEETHKGEFTVYFGNVHIVSDVMEYSAEYYFEDANGDFKKDEEISSVLTAKLGDEVSFDPAKTIVIGEGEDAVTYVLDSAENNVTSGIVNGNGTLVLKAYYSIVGSETLSGLRTDATLDFGAEDVGAVQEYVVTQYVVKTTEVAVDGDVESVVDYVKVPVDVTDDYQNLFTGSVADTSKLDGIFTIMAIGDKGAKAITFEQYKEGVFTWNNLNEVGHTEIVGAQLVGKYSKTKYTGTGVLTMENVDGVNYYKVAQADTTGSDAKFPYIRVFPVHSAEYYAMWYGATLTYSYKAEYVVEEGSANTAEDNLPLARVAYLGVADKGEGSFEYAQSGTWRSFSFTFNKLQFVRLSHITSTVNNGSFVGLRTWGAVEGQCNAVATPFNLYVGNITATKA